jgi:hypothetical protein
MIVCASLVIASENLIVHDLDGLTLQDFAIYVPLALFDLEFIGQHTLFSV